MTPGLKLIIFDCDGTLVDSQHLIVHAMTLAFESAGLPAPARSAILRTVGLSIPEAMAELAPNLTQQVREHLGQGYRDWNVSLRESAKIQEPMFKGAKGLLLDLATRDDIILGIATGKSRRGVTRFLEQNDLGGIFFTVQTADDAPSKPHPAMVLQAIREAGACPSETVMIGDTTFDMSMAVRASVTAIGVSWGHHNVAELRAAGAAKIADSFSDLTALLLPHAVSKTARAVAA